ncbi:MAG: ATP-binding protein [Verrucomicrobiota bacterium]
MPSWDSVAPSQWPFVGRDELLTLLHSLWTGGFSRGVLVEGQAGVGKTRLVDEFGQTLADGALLRCVGSPATQATPYAAIAHLIPASLPAKGIDDPRQVLQAVRAELAGVRRVLMADDVVFLDEPSLSLFAHLVGLGELFLVGTVRVGDTIPPGLDSMIRSFGLHRMTVEELDDAAVEAAASAVVGAALEPASAQRLVDSSGGNPLYLRELLLQAVAAERGHDDTLRSRPRAAGGGVGAASRRAGGRPVGRRARRAAAAGADDRGGRAA